MDRFILAGIIILTAIIWLNMIKLSHHMNEFAKKVLDEALLTRKVLCAALTAIIIEIVIKRVGEFDDEVCESITRIIEKFPEEPIVNEDGVWCKDYSVLMECFKAECREQEIVSSVMRCNTALSRVMTTKFSRRYLKTNQKLYNEIAHLNFIIMEIKQFSDQNFLSKWTYLVPKKLSL